IGTSTASRKTNALKKKHEIEPKEGDKSFYTLQEERIEQAERSVLISCPAKTNNKKLLKYLSRHGNINKCLFHISYVSISVVLRYESTNQHECMETKAMLFVCNYSMMGNSISKNN
uniref:RL domain-containing protein n=1 Tax=Salmo trutta TaxID=8032 RepID=A0A673YW31_SALTR